MNLTFRHRQPELMDQPGLDEQVHKKALVGIQRVNGISRISSVLWKAINHVVSSRKNRTVSLLDLACGGGDLPIQIAQLARRKNIDLSIDGFDISSTAVGHAKAKAKIAKVAGVEFYQCDALAESFSEKSAQPYDIVMCSLFLHHLEEEQVVHLLRKMADTARCAIIIDDLRRTRLGYYLAWAGCRLLSRSPIVHVDGPLSVEGAFTIDEAKSLAEKAGLHDTRFVKHFPQRFLMTWEKKEDFP